ncbi:MAG TPA: nitroreductase family protein [Jatrophihabitans sp.]|nr:nitroreductase family protein [Jatrophihabitans sp.]
MTGTNASAQDRLEPSTVVAALEVAVRAPSIHNTQPWRWRLAEQGLFLLADRERQLQVADPDGHSMLLSCGAALCLTEVGLRAAGYEIETTLLPDPADPDVLARFRVVGQRPPEAADEDNALAEAALHRRSDRRPFSHDHVTADEVDTVQRAGTDQHAWVDFPSGEDQRVNLAVAVSWADQIEKHDEELRAEASRWIHDPDVHSEPEGVSVEAFPHASPDAPRRTDIPLRDFEVGVNGRQLIERDVDEKPLIAVVLTEFDNPADHLAAGHAMMRVMLRAELVGLATCPLSQAVDFPAFRTRVQGLMGWVGYPQMMLRVGHPIAPDSQLAVTPRRPVSAVLESAYG